MLWWRGIFGVVIGFKWNVSLFVCRMDLDGNWGSLDLVWWLGGSCVVC